MSMPSSVKDILITAYTTYHLLITEVWNVKEFIRESKSDMTCKFNLNNIFLVMAKESGMA